MHLNALVGGGRGGGCDDRLTICDLPWNRIIWSKPPTSKKGNTKIFKPTAKRNQMALFLTAALEAKAQGRRGKGGGAVGAARSWKRPDMRHVLRKYFASKKSSKAHSQEICNNTKEHCKKMSD